MVSDRIQRRIERLLDEADEAVTRMDWQVVRDRVTTVLVLDPGNSDAQTFLAAAERALGTAPAPAPPPSPPAGTRWSASWARATRSEYTWPTTRSSTETLRSPSSRPMGR